MSTSGSEKHAIQVCLDVSDPLTRKREIKGLVTACKILRLARGTIISFDEQEKVIDREVEITIITLPLFLCEDG